MGTPEFAVASLEILLKNGFEIVGVVTATDKLGGRGNKTTIQSAVKQFAALHQLKVLQPAKLKDPAFLEELEALKADLQVVVAFRMLPEVVWKMPKLGTINLHGSLLPKYRGAAPINWAIINGDKVTGVTTFFLQHEIDTGDVLLQREVKIEPNETAGTLHDKMKEVGALTILETVQRLQRGTLSSTPQVDELASHAPKLFLHNCEIDFNKKGIEIDHFVRGLCPFPTAWFTFEGQIAKVFRVNFEVCTHSLDPGTVQITKKHLRIACLDGFVYIQDVQMSGRKRMEIQQFLNGYTGF